MADQDNERTDREEWLEEAADELRKDRWEELDALHHEDEEGSITVRKKDLKKLDIKDGDVIVVKRFPGLTARLLDWMADELGNRGFGNCIIVAVDRMSDLKSLDENVMRNYGWVKADAE